ncbi:ABC transporter ATP-binding protein [Chungangia koreensis]|uniref:ABC transporter ATP-binding protein n=1 Tax=Chungangia koreensis TaxID=752657 RepID=A0ABV8X0V4_9LACT
MENIALKVENLRTSFYTEDGQVKAVDGVSFTMNKGETIAIVGESGCGKSVTSFSILRLINPPGKIDGGSILFDGKDLAKIKESEMRKIRGNDISMIFQEPLTSLNPVFKVGEQIAETILLHQSVSKKEAKTKSIELLKKVGIARPEKIYESYPHSLSGGMRQRVMIAMALSCNPKILIADEPTTALDVTIQAQILNLMLELKEEFNTSIIIITHDLGVVAEMADKVIVMYAGQVVEESDVFTIFKEPKHPYTVGLMESTPKVHELEDELKAIPGSVPSASNWPKGCRFYSRCPLRMDHCREHSPELFGDETHQVRCWLHKEEVVTQHAIVE